MSRKSDDDGANGALPGRRRGLLASFVEQRGQATVNELAEELGVSGDTVRRDLEILARRGVLARTYGGAVSLGGLASTDTAFADRGNMDVKHAIAAAAAERLADGQTVLINGGTTTLAVGRALAIRKNLTVVTNNLRLPTELPQSSVRDVYLIGGAFRLSSYVTIGPVAFPGTKGVSADVALIGIGGVAAGAGLSTTNLSEAQMMAEMIASAQKTFVLCDSTKFGRSAFAHVASFSSIDLLITEERPTGALAEELDEAGVDVVVVR